MDTEGTNKATVATVDMGGGQWKSTGTGLWEAKLQGRRQG